MTISKYGCILSINIFIGDASTYFWADNKGVTFLVIAQIPKRYFFGAIGSDLSIIRSKWNIKDTPLLPLKRKWDETNHDNSGIP